MAGGTGGRVQAAPDDGLAPDGRDARGGHDEHDEHRGQAGPGAGGEDVPAGGPGERGRRALDRRLAVLGLTALLAVPLVVAVIALRDPRWFPLTDMAQYEMYVRDVPTTHPPMLGLTGRIYGYGTLGSHPGPLGFYLLWPVYQLLGSDGWSLQVSTAVLVVAASALAVWVGHRRGGWPLALAVTAMLALLLRGYGFTILIETWNPHLPLLWWVAFMLAIWAVLCGDLRALPVAVLAGNVCVQTHISYIPLVGGLGLLAGGVLVARAWRARRDGEAARWRRLLAWTGGSAGVVLLLWVPPLIEHVTHTPGNLSVIRHNFTEPVDDRLPFDNAFAIWVEHFDVPAIVGGGLKPVFPYDNIPINQAGLVVLAVWAVAAALAWRGGDPALRRLHLVVGVATGLALLGTSRIIGAPWPYLTYWGWGITAVMLLAIVWTFLSFGSAGQAGAASARPDQGDGEHDGVALAPLRWPQPSLAGLGLAAVVLVALFAVEAPDAEMDDHDQSVALGSIARATVDRLEEDPAGCGDDCRILVDWTDRRGIGAPGMGMLVALEREGYDANTLPGMESWVREHRTLRRSQVDLQVHVAVAERAIEEWRERDDAELVATAPTDDPARGPLAAFLVVPGHDAGR